MRRIGALIVIVFSLFTFNSCELLFQEPTGQVVFWSDFYGPGINIYVEEEFKGTISTFFETEPECGSIGNITVSLAPGTYTNWVATEIGYPFRTWNADHSQEILIQEEECLAIRLYPDATN